MDSFCINCTTIITTTTTTTTTGLVGDSDVHVPRPTLCHDIPVPSLSTDDHFHFPARSCALVLLTPIRPTDRPTNRPYYSRMFLPSRPSIHRVCTPLTFTSMALVCWVCCCCSFVCCCCLLLLFVCCFFVCWSPRSPSYLPPTVCTPVCFSPLNPIHPIHTPRAAPRTLPPLPPSSPSWFLVSWPRKKEDVVRCSLLG
jgi:hypothetical protein